MIITRPNGRVFVMSDNNKLKFGVPDIQDEYGILSDESKNLSSSRLKVFQNSSDQYPIRLIKNSSMNSGEYRLRMYNDKTEIYAKTEDGIKYGLVSLYQMFNMGHYREMFFVDKPKYQHREFMLDSARNYISVDEIKKIINEASLLKLNYFHWHLSDDQGFRIEIKRYSDLMDVAGSNGFYTEEEIKDIVKYAQVRGIEIIPEIDIPGHTRAILAAYPELSCDKRPRDIMTGYVPNTSALCVSNKKTYQFLYRIFDEVMDLFPGKYIHIGGDEVNFKSWCNCSSCRSFMEDNKINSFANLQGYFLNDIASYLIKNNKQPITWNDARTATNLDERIIIQNWMDIPFDKSTEKAYLNGGNIIATSTFANYFDYPYSLVSPKTTYEFTPKIRGNELIGNNLLGTSCHLWGEVINNSKELERLLFPRLIAFAENSWSNELDYKDFTTRLEAYLPKLDGIINYEKNYDIDISQKDEMVAEYFLKRMMQMPKSNERSSLKLGLMGTKIMWQLLNNDNADISKAKVLSLLASKKFLNK